jgi:hypothetical protein
MNNNKGHVVNTDDILKIFADKIVEQVTKLKVAELKAHWKDSFNKDEYSTR